MVHETKELSASRYGCSRPRNGVQLTVLQVTQPDRSSPFPAEQLITADDDEEPMTADDVEARWRMMDDDFSAPAHMPDDDDDDDEQLGSEPQIKPRQSRRNTTNAKAGRARGNRRIVGARQAEPAPSLSSLPSMRESPETLDLDESFNPLIRRLALDKEHPLMRRKKALPPVPTFKLSRDPPPISTDQRRVGGAKASSRTVLADSYTASSRIQHPRTSSLPQPSSSDLDLTDNDLFPKRKGIDPKFAARMAAKRKGNAIIKPEEKAKDEEKSTEPAEIPTFLF
jgi:hypothetical protein